MAEKRCLIIAPLYAGEAAEVMRPGPEDLLICADGGFAAAKRCGLAPQLVIGDFDSLGYVPEEGEVIRLPVEKDDTDMVVCIAEGRRRGFREFHAAGCLGGRFDHTMACLQCAADCALRGEQLWLYDAQNCVTILAPGDYSIPRHEGSKLSLLAFSETVDGLTLSGAAWELQDARLVNHYPLGCSNEWRTEAARISFQRGLLMLAISADSH